MKRKNIILIMADDMGHWSMGCAGDADVHTKNLDALAADGIRFENMFCASPVCSPARATLLTGRMPSCHGIHDWLAKGHIDYNEICQSDREKLSAEDSGWMYEWPRGQLMHDAPVRYLEDHKTYTDLLAKKGYTCALSGKWHLGDAGKAQNGFTYWKTTAMGGENYFYPYMLKEDGSFHMLDNVYITDYITQNALNFLEETDEEKPFYLSVHYTAPHGPWDQKHHPAAFYDLYGDTDFPSTPKLPPHPWGGSYTEEQRRKNLQGYYAAVTAMDAGIGAIVALLKAKGLYENTLLLFTADNGMSMGHHGIFGKGNGTFPMNMYDSAVKVPFIAVCPGVLPGGQVAGGLYSHYDLFPTFAEMLLEPLDESYPGESFLPLLLGEKENSSRDEIVVMDEYGPVRMIRTKTQKYVHRYPYGPHELYDLVNDPAETQNLALNPDNAAIARMAELRGRMEAWFARHTVPDRDGRCLEVTGLGQTGPVGEQARGMCQFKQRG